MIFFHLALLVTASGAHRGRLTSGRQRSGGAYSSDCIINDDCDLARVCIDMTCQDPCPGVCRGHSTCKTHNHVVHCGCKPGYSGTPSTGCNLRPPSHKYYVGREKVKWVTAIEKCHSMGMDLIAILSADQQANVKAALISIGNKQRPLDSELWISGSDWTTSGTYVWYTTGGQFSFTNWGGGQPEVSHEKHCILLHNTEYNWSTSDCNQMRYYMCQIPIEKEKQIQYSTLL